MKDFFSYKAKTYPVKSLKLFDNNLCQIDTKFSFAIPTYNRGELLLESVRSILASCSKAQLTNFEILVVDNSATDASLEYLKTHLDLEKLQAGFRYYRNEENLGMFGNWNRCLELATSNWVSILNDDDLFHEDAMPALMRHFEPQGKLFLLQNMILNEKENSPKAKIINKIKAFKLTAIHQMTLDDYYWGMPSMGSLGVFFKKDIALEIGGFPEEFYPINDWVFFSNYMKKVKKGLKIHAPTVYYRIGSNESMKPEVASKSLELSFEFRKFLGTEMNKVFNHFYCQMFILIRIYGNKRLWKIESSGKPLAELYGLTWGHFIFYPIFRYMVFIKKLI